MAHGHGHSIDEYLEVIYFLAFPIGEYRPAGESAIASRVAEMLGVSRASAGEMLKRLEAEGLVERGEQKEAILTAAGIERAERVVRKHRLIERFLTDFMGYTAYESHEKADEMGDTFTDDMIERINERLGFPDRCPHGWPIETEVEQAENAGLVALAELPAGPERRDRPARRARRRAAALVLRRGLRAGLGRRGARGAARRGPGEDRPLGRGARHRAEGRRGPVRQARSLTVLRGPGARPAPLSAVPLLEGRAALPAGEKAGPPASSSWSWPQGCPWPGPKPRPMPSGRVPLTRSVMRLFRSAFIEVACSSVSRPALTAASIFFVEAVTSALTSPSTDLPFAFATSASDLPLSSSVWSASSVTPR